MTDDKHKLDRIINDCLDKRRLLRFCTTVDRENHTTTNLNFGTARGDTRYRLAITPHGGGWVFVTLYLDGGTCERHCVQSAEVRRMLDYIHGLTDGINHRHL